MADDTTLTSFIEQFNGFLVTCNELEDNDAWDKEANGPIELYLQADLLGVVLQLMSVDGHFEQAEADVVNTMFGGAYAPEELEEVFGDLDPIIEDYCDGQKADTLALLLPLSPALADTYRDLILMAARIVSESDGVAEGQEKELIHRLEQALSQR